MQDNIQIFRIMPLSCNSNEHEVSQKENLDSKFTRHKENTLRSSVSAYNEFNSFLQTKTVTYPSLIPSPYKSQFR